MNVAQVLKRYIPQPLVAMVALPAAVMLIEHAVVEPWPTLSLGAFKWSGTALISSGVALAAWCGVTFFRSGQTWDYFDTPTRLITNGPYRLSRHPVYLGGVLVLAAVQRALQCADRAADR